MNGLSFVIFSDPKSTMQILLFLLLLRQTTCFNGRYTSVESLAIIPSYHHKRHRPNIISIRNEQRPYPPCIEIHTSMFTANNVYDDDDEFAEYDNNEDMDDDALHPHDWFVEDDETENDTTTTEATVASMVSASNNFIAAPITLDQLSEAFATNVSYFYLKNELQLSDTAMWRITYEASSALGMTTTTIRHKINVLQEMMNLTSDNVRTILERQPTILHLSADQNLAPTLLFLLRALELGRDELREIVVACPAVLCYSINNLKSKIQFFTQLMKYSTQECRELLLSKPDLVRASVTTGLIPHYQFLMSDMELSILQLKKIVQKNPNILLYSLEENLIPKLVYYMIMRLQMNTMQVQKLLLSFPQILDCNLERTILPMTSYFINELEFNPIEFRNMLLKFPRLFTHALRKVKRTIGYFRYELNMLSTQVKKVVYRAPAVLGLNLEQNIRPKVQFIQSTLGLSDDELYTVIAAMPSLLLLNSEGNLRPKIDFLLSALLSCADSNNSHNKNYPFISSPLSTTEQLRDVVLRLPTLLGYSLEQRIIPRVQAIMDAGLDPSCITIGIPMTQPAFGKWLQRRRAKNYHEENVLPVVKGSDKKLTNTPILLLPPAKDVSIIIATQSDKSSSSGIDQRIVHWIRERRPKRTHPPES